MNLDKQVINQKYTRCCTKQRLRQSLYLLYKHYGKSRKVRDTLRPDTIYSRNLQGQNYFPHEKMFDTIVTREM